VLFTDSFHTVSEVSETFVSIEDLTLSRYVLVTYLVNLVYHILYFYLYFFILAK